MTSVNQSVIEPMELIVKEDIPNVQNVKKKFDIAKRDYDNAESRVLALMREKKPNPPKIQQSEVERDQVKETYELKGDESYCALRDINEQSQLELVEKVKIFDFLYIVC